jgi:hypothetical protein
MKENTEMIGLIRS